MKDRADKILFERGLVTSRSQAKSLIEKGDVSANGVTLKKAGELIDLEAQIEIVSTLYVGRGAFKLEKALEAFSVNPQDKICLDVGASTGGFTEVLLMNGASKVYAIDVGRDQLAEKLRQDNRVINLESTNIRELDSLTEKADLAVMDLSFISITKVLNNVFHLLNPEGELIALVKPQFEIGRELLPKDGVVKLEEDRVKALTNVTEYAVQNGWRILGQIISPIEGKMGNQEYLIHLKKSEI